MFHNLWNIHLVKVKMSTENREHLITNNKMLRIWDILSPVISDFSGKCFRTQNIYVQCILTECEIMIVFGKKNTIQLEILLVLVAVYKGRNIIINIAFSHFKFDLTHNYHVFSNHRLNLLALLCETLLLRMQPQQITLYVSLPIFTFLKLKSTCHTMLGHSFVRDEVLEQLVWSINSSVL